MKTLIFLLVGSFAHAATNAENELRRLNGFIDDQGAKKVQNLRRENEVDNQKLKRAKEQNDLNKLAKEHSQKRALEKKLKDESTEMTPEHRQHLRKQFEHLEELEAARNAYIQNRDQNSHKLSNRPISEDFELGLVPEPERVDWNKRKVFVGSGGSVGGPSYSPGPDTSREPYPLPEPDNSPAPPPPPPPFDQGAEDSMAPPPVFDDDY